MQDTVRGMGRRQALVLLLGTACIAMLPARLIDAGTPSTVAKNSSALEISEMQRGSRNAQDWRNVYLGPENNWGYLPDFPKEVIRSLGLSASSGRNATGDAMAHGQ